MATERFIEPSHIEDTVLDRAASIGTASLHEAVGRRGALPHEIKPIAPTMHVAGRAFPVRSPVGDNLWLHRALEQASAGDVLVIDAGRGAGFGYWGEIMASAALARGIAGIVLTGGVRDSLRLIELGLPTFALGLAIQGTAKNRTGDGSLSSPIRVGEVVIRKGDLIVGDADGVMCLPAGDAEPAVASAEQRDAAEQDILQRIARGELTLDIYELRSGSPHAY